MRLHLCGVRGSTPAPGAAFVRYGGHTSCVAVAHGASDVPRLLIDAGTGIRNVTGLLEGKSFEGSILLGHLHWDHTQGLPFFGAGDRPDSKVTLYLPAQGGVEAQKILAPAMSPPHFPIEATQMRGDWTFTGLDEGEYEIEGLQVLAREIPHKGGRTFGYRVSDGAHSFAYLSDHHPWSAGPGPHDEGEYHEAALALASDVDLLIHDAQYTSDEFPARRHFGHSTVRYAIGLGVAANAKHVLLFHHDPAHTDGELDVIAAGLDDAGVPVTLAREGALIEL